MFGAIIVNRNLGSVCDLLVQSVSEKFPLDYPVEVVDCSTEESLMSTHATVVDSSPSAQEKGLRFGRGMNQGIKAMSKRGPLPPWVLLLPVDTEIVDLDLGLLKEHLTITEKLIALKPTNADSNPYADLMGKRSIGLGWNFEEGPWLIKGSFIQSQLDLAGTQDFFDEDNFRGYLTSAELAFRAYANGFAVGLTKALIVRENESYLLEKSELLRTETMDENARLLVEEGLHWLRKKYRVKHPWSFELLAGFCFENFISENPNLGHLALRRMRFDN